jgi:hypothetical protein
MKTFPHLIVAANEKNSINSLQKKCSDETSPTASISNPKKEFNFKISF